MTDAARGEAVGSHRQRYVCSSCCVADAPNHGGLGGHAACLGNATDPCDCVACLLATHAALVRERDEAVRALAALKARCEQPLPAAAPDAKCRKCAENDERQLDRDYCDHAPSAPSHDAKEEGGKGDASASRATGGGR